MKRPAVFLDRDGVLTEERGYVDSLENLHIFPYTEECIREIVHKGYLPVVITNQSGVARGLIDVDVLQQMNALLKSKTGVEAVYYCPHLPEAKCHCRKPETGLVEAACRDYDIDMDRSVFVGDRASDIELGERLGLRTVLLESGYGSSRLERKVCPQYIFKDLRDVIQIL